MQTNVFLLWFVEIFSRLRLLKGCPLANHLCIFRACYFFCLSFIIFDLWFAPNSEKWLAIRHWILRCLLAIGLNLQVCVLGLWSKTHCATCGRDLLSMSSVFEQAHQNVRFGRVTVCKTIAFTKFSDNFDVCTDIQSIVRTNCVQCIVFTWNMLSFHVDSIHLMFDSLIPSWFIPLHRFHPITHAKFSSALFQSKRNCSKFATLFSMIGANTFSWYFIWMVAQNIFHFHKKKHLVLFIFFCWHLPRLVRRRKVFSFASMI